MAKSNNADYFVLLKELSEYSLTAAKQLKTMIENFEYEGLREKIFELHNIEHTADDKLHYLTSCLMKEFITPIEREDILRIGSSIDDITDAIEEVLLRMYMFNIKHIRRDCLDLIDVVVKGCECLIEVFDEFKNFKKGGKIMDLVMQIDTIEEEGDRLHVSLMRNLYNTSIDPIEVFTWSDIYEHLEACCDALEETADAVREVAMKNS